MYVCMKLIPGGTFFRVTAAMFLSLASRRSLCRLLKGNVPCLSHLSLFRLMSAFMAALLDDVEERRIRWKHHKLGRFGIGSGYVNVRDLEIRSM